MPTSTLFIGLVSHEKSSFTQSVGPQGLVEQLSARLSILGVSNHVRINLSNLFDDNNFLLTDHMSRESVREEIRLESQWFQFLERDDKLSQLVRVLGRRAKFFLDWQRNSQDRELRRLLNIEYSHVDLYRAAVELGASWAIILEDDAASSDVNGLVGGLLTLIQSNSNVKMINLSESFTLDQIGIRHLLRPLDGFHWVGNSARRLLGARKPATNTVCAIAFRTDFLTEILADFDAQPAFPVVPIDWKVNATLMRLYESGAIGANECLFIEPAPIIQLSMVQDREAN